MDTKVVPSNLQSPPAPHQMNLMFDAIELRGMSAPQRTKATSCLASLLLQAAGIVARGHDDDEH
jgi:hypothetical protein